MYSFTSRLTQPRLAHKTFTPNDNPNIANRSHTSTNVHTVYMSEVSGKPAAPDKPYIFDPSPPPALVKIRIHATPHTTFSIRFFGPSAKVAKCGASRFPHTKKH